MKTKLIKVNAAKPEMEKIKEAAFILRKGGLVAFPTETVYGLGADYMNKYAVERLYKVKRRPQNKPFTVHIADLRTLDELSCKIPRVVMRLIKRFWPGPLTIVFKTKNDVKVGVRMPANRIALDFILACDTPIAAPSANISGKKPPLSAEDVLLGLGGKIDLILDGGKTEIGVESTVLDTSSEPYRILREGAIKKSEIEKITT